MKRKKSKKKKNGGSYRRRRPRALDEEQGVEVRGTKPNGIKDPD